MCECLVPNGCSVPGGSGGAALREEVCPWRWAFRVWKWHTTLVPFPCFVPVSEMWPVGFSSGHHACCLLPHFPSIMNPVPLDETIAQIKPFYLAFYHSDWSMYVPPYNVCHCLKSWTQTQQRFRIRKAKRVLWTTHVLCKGDNCESAQIHKAVPGAHNAHKEQWALPPWNIWDSWSPSGTLPGMGEKASSL